MKKLLNWFRRGDLENGLDRELQYHFERRVNDLKQSGLPEWEARRRAKLELGGATQVREEVRDVWLMLWLRDFVYDLRFSLRSFLRNPSFTATTVLSLALGIGATTAIYSLVDQVVLRALPVRQPEGLVLVDWNGANLWSGFGSWNLMSYPICRDLQQQDRFFEGVLCRASTTVNFATGADPKTVAVEVVSGSYFSVLGVRPALGRVFGDEDDKSPGASPFVVLSYDFWKTQFDAAPDVVGRKVLINQHPMTIAGVAAAEFRGVDVGEVPVLWIPAAMSAQVYPGFNEMFDRRTSWMQILGRLAPGVTPARAQSGLQPWFKAMLDEDTRRPGFPVVTIERRKAFLASTLELIPAPQGHSPLRRVLTEPLLILLAATSVLLGLACLNVAGLFLARGTARERETSTRLALGASRGRIGRQLIADSLILAFVGGLLGVLLAPLAMRTLIAFLPDERGANNLHASVDLRLLLFAFVVSLTAGVLSGLGPALKSGRDSLISSLRERGGTALGGVRLRKAIVTAQIAFTLILVIGAGLFVGTLNGLMSKGPGFSTTSLVSFFLQPLHNGYSPVEAKRLIQRIGEEIRASPEVQASGVARFQFLTGRIWGNQMTIETNRRVVTDRVVSMNAVSPGFFATLGARIVAGRDFDAGDTRPAGEHGYRSAIVNEAFVKRYFEGRNPLGARVCIGDGPDAKPNIEIVGVVKDFSNRGLREESEQAYFPIFERKDGDFGAFYVRVRGTPEAAFQSIRAIVQNADPGIPIEYFRTADEQVRRSVNTERILASLSAGFGVLALVLSLVGLYGVMSFVVTQRTREIGIRLALGATRGSAIWLVLREVMFMVGAGMAIGLPCVWALGRLVESQLFGITPTDPSAVGGAALLLALAALGAGLIPAYRASIVNPTDALRFD